MSTSNRKRGGHAPLTNRSAVTPFGKRNDGGGRGHRGGRGRRGSMRDVPDAEGFLSSVRSGSASAATSGQPSDVNDEDVRVTLSGAFARSFPEVTRVKERARVFWVSTRGSRANFTGNTLTATTTSTDTPGKRIFIVTERTVAGLDDIVYEKHRDVWESLPRGNARVFSLRDVDSGRDASHAAQLHAQLAALASVEERKRRQFESVSLTRKDVVPLAAINGLRKFSYNDKPAESKGSDYGYEADVDAVVALDKENGECGHISAFTLPLSIGGDSSIGKSSTDAACERYWVLGSKNVHIVLPYRFTEEDLAASYRAKRYSYAAKIARQWAAVMALADRHDAAVTTAEHAGLAKPAREKDGVAADPIDIDTESFRHVTGEKLLRFHSTLSEGNRTACFEAIFCDSQHLVDYPPRNTLRFFALTENDTYEPSMATTRALADNDGTLGGGEARGQANEHVEAVDNAVVGAVAGRQSDRTESSYVHGLCVDILRSFHIFAECGLPTVALYYGGDAASNTAAAAAIAAGTGTLPKVPYHSEAFAALVDAIGHRRNSEGCVVYGYKCDPHGHEGGPPLSRVVKIWKVKAYPYIMERATREAIVNHRLAGSALLAKMSKKMALQKPHIRQYFAAWEKDRLPFLVLFSAYLQITSTLTPFMSRDDSFMTVRNHWLSLQRAFAEKMESDYELRAVCERFVPGEHAGSAATGGVSGNGRAPHRSQLRLDVVKFVGAQGCGKSTLSRILFFLLAEANMRPRWVNQDEAGGRNNYLAAIHQAALEAATAASDDPAQDRADNCSSSGRPLNNGITHLIVDKMNLDQRTNADYASLPEPAVTVCFTYESEGVTAREAVSGDEGHAKWESSRRSDALTELLLSRVLKRGSGHRTIKVFDAVSGVEREQEEARVRTFLAQAVRACQLPEDDENIVFVDVTDPLSRQVARIWDALGENGFHELPPLDVLHLSVAIDVAHRYEEVLRKQARPPVYACLAVPASDNKKLLSAVRSAMGTDVLAGMRVQSAFHVTTKYFVGDPDPLYLVALAELQGQTIDLTLEAVVADRMGVAIRVRNVAHTAADTARSEVQCANDMVAHFLSTEGGPGGEGEPGVKPRSAFPCANAIPHITVANAPGVPPKYSNELLANNPGVTIPGNVTVKGIFTFR